MLRVVSLQLVILICASAALGCSMVTGLPVADEAAMYRGRMLQPAVGPHPFVFTGEVVAIFTVTKPSGTSGLPNAEAVRIRVDEQIVWSSGGLGAGPRYYDVLPLAIYPDCSLRGQTGMAQAFPVGTKVRVIASEAKVYGQVAASGSDAGGSPALRPATGLVNLSDQVIATPYNRLEVSLFNGGRISRNDLALGLETNSRLVYDYRNYSTRKPPTREGQTALYSKQEFLAFELQKDLTRLQRARTEKERIAVLERLVYYPFPLQLAFHRLIAGYMPDGVKREQLGRLWDERKRVPIEVGLQM